MTGAEIITAAEALTNEDYEDAIWLDWINFCLDDLSTVLYKPGRSEVSLAVGDYDYSVPSGIQHIIGATYKTAAGVEAPLTQLDPLDFYSVGWKYSDEILLQGKTPAEGDKIVLYCYVTLAHIAATSETPELDTQYHELIVLYLASRSQQREEELEDKVDFYEEYLKRRTQLAEDRKAQMEKWKRA